MELSENKVMHVKKLLWNIGRFIDCPKGVSHITLWNFFSIDNTSINIKMNTNKVPL